MRLKSNLPIQPLVCLCMMAASIGATPVAMPPPDGATLAGQYKAVFTRPPVNTPSTSAVDAPLMGNGDTLVAIGGAADRLQFHIGKSDLWELGPNKNSSLPLAMIELAFPGLQGASYHMEQDLLTAVTTGRFEQKNRILALETGVLATGNILWIRLEALSGSIPGQAILRPPAKRFALGKPPVARLSGLPVVERTFDGRLATGAACALRPLTGGESFTLEPGKPVILVATTESLFQTRDFRNAAVRQALALDEARLAGLRAAHAAWWRRFWNESFVEIPDKLLEQRYYLSHYVLASASRNPDFPPGLFGWVTTDSSRWGGCYFLNYNFVAPFYGLTAANHLAQAEPCSHPFFSIGKSWAANPAPATPGVAGIYQCRTIGPLSSYSPAGRPFGNRGGSPEQKSNGAYSCVPLAQYWYATYDLDYAKRAYPYVKGVATFWEHWLKFEQGRYNDPFDPVHEESGNDLNPIQSLGLIRMVMNLAVDMSTELGIDPERQAKWLHIRDHLAPYPACTVRDLPREFWPRHLPRDEHTLSLPIFRYTEKGLPWNRGNTLGIQHIFPAGGIGLDSPAELLERARNQILVMNRWIDFNGMNSFYAAAARVGYDPDIILRKLHGMIEALGLPNGMIRDNPHGMEHQSIVPNAIQEMLMQSHENVIRFFPCWPRDRDARFGTLRARGAFLVSATLKGSVVTDVTIHSEKGRDCTVQNPWPGMAIRIIRDGKPAETVSGARFTLRTTANETLTLSP